MISESFKKSRTKLISSNMSMICQRLSTINSDLYWLYHLDMILTLHTMRLLQNCMRTIEFCINYWSRIWWLWMMSRLLYKITRKILSEVLFYFHDYSIDTQFISFTTLFLHNKNIILFFKIRKLLWISLKLTLKLTFKFIHDFFLF